MSNAVRALTLTSIAPDGTMRVYDQLYPPTTITRLLVEQPLDGASLLAGLPMLQLRVQARAAAMLYELRRELPPAPGRWYEGVIKPKPKPEPPPRL